MEEWRAEPVEVNYTFKRQVMCAEVGESGAGTRQTQTYSSFIQPFTERCER